MNINLVYAQSSPSSAPYNKVSQPALMLELPYSQNTSEDFIIDNLKRTGYNVESKGKFFWKQNKLNGFYTFKGVNLEGLSQSVDLYFKVDQKSRRDKNESVIYMLVSKGNENFISPDSDPEIYNAAKKMLDGFITQSASYKLDLDIKAQEDAVRNAEKKLGKLQDSEKDLNKRLNQLQDDLKKNRMDQENQQRALENERRRLADLKAKGINQ
ncbi:MAG TPA: hypothetical protein VGO09_05300 [Flavisolibacter sp.]|nr:hypothetical protein [Flavisolibacter sp.]